MEFLYKLYDMEYFGIGLFIVIAILIFLFLIILFFGKKDEKNRKLEETKKLELEATNGFKEEKEKQEDLSIPVIEQPVIQDSVVNEVKPNSVEINSETLVDNFMPRSLDEIENDFTVTDAENKMDSSLEIPSNSLNDIDIDSLFQANITSDINEIPQNNENKEDIILENVEEKKELENIKMEVPFSSVYMNNELPKMNENLNIEESKVENEKNTFELPKMADNQNIITDKKEQTPTIEKIADFDSLFGEIETETYNINK